MAQNGTKAFSIELKKVRQVIDDVLTVANDAVSVGTTELGLVKDPAKKAIIELALFRAQKAQQSLQTANKMMMDSCCNLQTHNCDPNFS